MRKTENIYTTTIEILNRAKENNLTTHKAALQIAQARIDARRKENR
jgi:leucine dehydrogenase